MAMNVWWKDVVKPAIERKEAAWKKVLGTKDEGTKERSMETYKEEKKEVNE